MKRSAMPEFFDVLALFCFALARRLLPHQRTLRHCAAAASHGTNAPRPRRFWYTYGSPRIVDRVQREQGWLVLHHESARAPKTETPK